MHNDIRRVDRKIEESEAFEILKKGEFGVLSMCTPGNEGYGIPLNYVFFHHEIYFHCALKGSKLDFLKNNHLVSFCVVGKTEVIPSKFGTLYESVIVAGSATEIDGEEKTRALKHIVEKYSNDFIQEGNEYIKKFYDRVKVIKLTISNVSGKARKV